MKKTVLMMIMALILLVPVLSFISLDEKDPAPEMDIYLISNDIHVGLLLPLKNDIIDWKPFIVNGNFQELPGMQWIEFGWGDRQFYFEMPTWDHFSLRIVLDALFFSDPAIMHVGLLEGTPLPSPYLRRVRISYKTYEKMVKAIQSWFVLKDGKPILIPGKGYSPADNFFEARGSYSLIKTCNVWTSDIFAEAGLKHPLWSPTKYGLEMMWAE